MKIRIRTLEAGKMETEWFMIERMDVLWRPPNLFPIGMELQWF